MNIDTDQWCTGSEAARLLGVSPQRIDALANDGLLDVIRPWGWGKLISRRSIAARLAGERATRTDAGTVRRWLETATGMKVEQLDIDTVRDQVRNFIDAARPRWDNTRQDLWALNMASQLSATRKEPAS